ncbi:hypothetical protein GPALN_010905 [Globodera pallida]|nr:hypothetical protein GPALN_010905 [Globodera pallida]
MPFIFYLFLNSEGPIPIPQSAAPPPSSKTKNIDEGPPSLLGAAAPPQVPSSKADFDADAVQPPAGPAPPQKGIVSSNVDPCAAATTKSQHFVCQNLFKLDKNAREQAARPQLLGAAAPSIAGVPSPDVGGESGPIFIAAASIAATPYECMDLGCLCEYVGGKRQEGSNICQLANGQPLRKALRKEYRMLTDDERARYHAALKAIKKSGEYDNFARIHSDPAIVGGAHSGPAFLPWHREYLKRMEIALRQVDPTIAIPYWDSSLEAQLPTPADSHLFTKEFMGSTDEQGNLVYGHFANWKTIEGTNIRRRVGTDEKEKGFTENEINWFLSQVQIDQILAFSAPEPGITHGGVHTFVGGLLPLPNGTDEADGDMADSPRAANDPIFYMLHSFVDFTPTPMPPSTATTPKPIRPVQTPTAMLPLLATTAKPIRPVQTPTPMPPSSATTANPITPVQTPKPMPPSTATTPKPIRPVQSCYNEHECCSVWAQKGECQRNQGYMHAWCKASCHQCQPDYDLYQGRKLSPIMWQVSCFAATDRITLAPPTSKCASRSCYNENICCQLWGLAGECRRNPTWMNCFCRVSCGRCIPQDYDFGGCADYHQRCRHWAKSGECVRNAWMLENCRWSCGTCVGFWELRQLCRMGGNGRGKRAADGMPAIDFANMDMSSLISRFVREVNRNRTNEEGDAGLLAADIAPGAGVSMNSPGGEKAGPNIDEGPPPIPPSAAPPPSSKTKNIDEGPPPIPQSAAPPPPPSSNTKNIDEGPPPLVGAAAPPQVPSSKADFDAGCRSASRRAGTTAERAAPPLLSAIPKMPSIAGVPPRNGQEGSNVCQLANGQPLRKALRKEYRMLTDDERARYHAALKAIKQSGEYDNIARIHSNPTIVGGAHSGPAFLPWHREYLKRMEIALRQVDPTIAIPYWDSSLEAQLPTPADSHLFTKEFMGSTDEQGNLVYGHFANWKTIDGNPNIRRRVGRDGKGFTEDEINWFLNQVQIDQIMTYSAPQPGMEFRWMEITHGNVHLFVGGSFVLPNGTDEADGDMAEQTRSANDPIFFMHHSFVDYVWEMWRQSKQTRENREKEYPMDNAQCASPQHFGSAPMRPFEPWQNRDGLNNKYTDNMFEYAPRPTCQMGPNCGSKLLFCDRSHGQPHCAAKVRPGGNCTGFINGEDVCLNGICQNGQCRQTNNNDNTPTPMPPSPATTEKPIRPVQSCYNEHECCSVWAQKGECQQNQGYMHAWCKASCQQCQPDYDLYQECNNRHPNCQTWTSQGQCQRNKFWMAENCRQSCGKCRVSRQQVCSGGQDSQQNRDRITLAPPASKCASRSCFNENICCQLWGLAGECRRNPTWMNCFCRVSCGRCVPQDYDFGGCADYSQRCRYWANSGECGRNAWMLENCRWSCGTCVGFWELRQLCRMGGNGRGKRAADGMPAIDFANMDMSSLISRFVREVNRNRTNEEGDGFGPPVHGIPVVGGGASDAVRSAGPPSDRFAES